MTSDEADRCGPPHAVYQLALMPGTRFECRPISRPPSDNSVAFMYRRKGEGYAKSGIGFYRDGQWKNSKGRVLDGDYLWMDMINE